MGGGEPFVAIFGGKKFNFVKSFPKIFCNENIISFISHIIHITKISYIFRNFISAAFIWDKKSLVKRASPLTPVQGSVLTMCPVLYIVSPLIKPNPMA